MNKALLIFGFIILSQTISVGQEMHTQAEILKIMEKSRVTYVLSNLENEILPSDRTDNLNYGQYYRVTNENEILTYKYEINEDAKEYLSKAEQLFQDDKFKMTRDMYLKVLEVDSTYYQVMTYIGQTYGIEGDFNKAIEWYIKTIELNYIDYMAHWFLADAYKSQNKLDKAVDEITIAMILNRNNPRIMKALIDIYALKKLKTSDWVFNPQMQIDSTGVNKVKIIFNMDWFGYALVKAVWLYEPGYKESMGAKESSFSTTEEKECLVSLIATIHTIDKKRLKKYPEFNALQLAFDHKMVNEYIFYEIILLDYPFVAYQLTEEFINDIKDYVIQIRGKQK